MEIPQFRVQVMEGGQVIKTKLFPTKEETKTFYQACLVECDEIYGTDFGGRMRMETELNDGTWKEIEMDGEEQCKQVNGVAILVRWNELPEN